MQFVYFTNSGRIIARIPKDADYNIIFSKRGKEFIDSLSSVVIYDDIDDIKYYYIDNGILVRRNNNEIEEVNRYGKILNDEERLNILLQPSSEEISKAESTLEMLIMLEEVGLI